MNISVLMCLYIKDNPGYFEEAYKSMLSQTKMPSEFVLVEDGPISSGLAIMVESLIILSESLNVNFKHIKLKSNKGHGEARRAGVFACSHEFIAIADSDDLYDSSRLERQISLFEKNPELSVVGSQITEVEHNTLLPIGIRKVPTTHDEIVRVLKFKCPFNQMSVMLRKKSVMDAGNYESFFHNEDYFLWIKMHLLNLRFSNLESSLVRARVNPFFYKRRGGSEYFKSELRIQKILYGEKINNIFVFLFNVSVRFVLQYLLPDSVRGKLFKLLFRRRA